MPKIALLVQYFVNIILQSKNKKILLIFGMNLLNFMVLLNFNFNDIFSNKLIKNGTYIMVWCNFFTFYFENNMMYLASKISNT